MPGELGLSGLRSPPCWSRGCERWLGYHQPGLGTSFALEGGRQGARRAAETLRPLQQRVPGGAGRRGRGASRSWPGRS